MKMQQRGTMDRQRDLVRFASTQQDKPVVIHQVVVAHINAMHAVVRRMELRMSC